MQEPKIHVAEETNPELSDRMLDGTREILLKYSLALAVPLWIERVAEYTAEQRAERAHACAQEIAEHGDAILYRTKRKTAKAFNALAEGLACLAFAPGGVRFLGLRFQVGEGNEPEGSGGRSGP